MKISNRKHVDRAGNVAWHMYRGRHHHVIRFTAKQYQDERDRVLVSILRARSQLKGVDELQQLSEGEHK